MLHWTLLCRCRFTLAAETCSQHIRPLMVAYQTSDWSHKMRVCVILSRYQPLDAMMRAVVGHPEVLWSTSGVFNPLKKLRFVYEQFGGLCYDLKLDSEPVPQSHSTQHHLTPLNVRAPPYHCIESLRKVPKLYLGSKLTSVYKKFVSSAHLPGTYKNIIWLRWEGGCCRIFFRLYTLYIYSMIMPVSCQHGYAITWLIGTFLASICQYINHWWRRPIFKSKSRLKCNDVYFSGNDNRHISMICPVGSLDYHLNELTVYAHQGWF